MPGMDLMGFSENMRAIPHKANDVKAFGLRIHNRDGAWSSEETGS